MEIIDKYEIFRKKYQSYLDKPPWDHESNPYGFRKENENPDLSSDISAHLPIIEYFASQCEHATEFGTRNCQSTSALISGVGKKSVGGMVISYDICTTPNIYQFIALERRRVLPCKWKFVQKNTLSNFEIDQTELLFVDTLHTYDQVKGELDKHGHKVSKYLLFHDTYSQGSISVDRKGEKGINPAIEEYADVNGWEKILDLRFNHGMSVWGRT